MKTLTVNAAALLFLIPSLAFADCTFNGKPHKEGARIGPYVCEQGNWVFK